MNPQVDNAHSAATKAFDELVGPERFHCFILPPQLRPRQGRMDSVRAGCTGLPVRHSPPCVRYSYPAQSARTADSARLSSLPCRAGCVG